MNFVSNMPAKLVRVSTMVQTFPILQSEILTAQHLIDLDDHSFYLYRKLIPVFNLPITLRLFAEIIQSNLGQTSIVLKLRKTLLVLHADAIFLLAEQLHKQLQASKIILTA